VCQPAEANRLTSESWCVRPPPFFCFSLLMTDIWSPSSEPSSVKGWTWRSDDSGWRASERDLIYSCAAVDGVNNKE